MLRDWHLIFAMALALCAPPATCQAPDPLPDPLTLEVALSLADEGHPELEKAEADRRLAEAEVDAARARRGTHISARGFSRYVDPNPEAQDQSHDDQSVGLAVVKPLLDFGRSAAAREAAQHQLRGTELAYLNARARHRLDVMARFFDVILADLTYARDNEAMAAAYVDYDRARDRNELGQVSDVVLLEFESRYQEARSRRYASQSGQRAARARLALALNRPDRLPATLVEPDLAASGRDLPEVESLIQEALANNPGLRALRAQVQSAQEGTRAARAEARPMVYGEVEGAYYTRNLSSRDRFRAGVQVEVPLYQGGAVAASVARQQAEVQRLQAILMVEEMRVREAVLDAWLELQTLQARREEVGVLRQYRDLSLDRIRALYELEVRADLGEAMVEVSEVRLKTAEVEYGSALAWARLDTLVGRLEEGP